MSTKNKKEEKNAENSDDNQVWRNSRLIKAVSGILSEIINENKNSDNSKSKIKYIK